jgi:hypothetical protein
MNRMTRRMTKGRESNKMTEDRIPIKNFSSARALKEEIRKRIDAREGSNWSFSRIVSNGAVISLRFESKPKSNNEASY